MKGITSKMKNFEIESQKSQKTKAQSNINHNQTNLDPNLTITVCATEILLCVSEIRQNQCSS